MEYIAFDAHKYYTLASVARPDGQVVREERIEHDRANSWNAASLDRPWRSLSLSTARHGPAFLDCRSSPRVESVRPIGPTGGPNRALFRS